MNLGDAARLNNNNKNACQIIKMISASFKTKNVAYLINQIKTPEEIYSLRSTLYNAKSGKTPVFVIGVYDSYTNRLKNLIKKIDGGYIDKSRYESYESRFRGYSATRGHPVNCFSKGLTRSQLFR